MKVGILQEDIFSIQFLENVQEFNFRVSTLLYATYLKSVLFFLPPPFFGGFRHYAWSLQKQKTLQGISAYIVAVGHIGQIFQVDQCDVLKKSSTLRYIVLYLLFLVTAYVPADVCFIFWHCMMVPRGRLMRTQYKRSYRDVSPTLVWVDCSKFSKIWAKIGPNSRKFWKNQVILLKIGCKLVWLSD